jgi:hypothetical protein
MAGNFAENERWLRGCRIGELLTRWMMRLSLFAEIIGLSAKFRPE